MAASRPGGRLWLGISPEKKEQANHGCKNEGSKEHSPKTELMPPAEDRAEQAQKQIDGWHRHAIYSTLDWPTLPFREGAALSN